MNRGERRSYAARARKLASERRARVRSGLPATPPRPPRCKVPVSMHGSDGVTRHYTPEGELWGAVLPSGISVQLDGAEDPAALLDELLAEDLRRAARRRSLAVAGHTLAVIAGIVLLAAVAVGLRLLLGGAR